MEQVSIVTGAASGIGAALTAALRDRGGHVVAVDLDGAGLRELAARADGGPGSVETAELDVADAARVVELVRDVHHRHGRLDHVFNNAGIGVGGEPEELDLEHWDRTIDVNIRGVVHGCHAAYPIMQAQGFGHLVNTASLAGLLPSAGQVATYAMSKYAVVGLSLSLRAAGAEHGVQVHVVCPGVVDTPILDSQDVPGLPTAPSVAAVDRREAFAAMGFKAPYPADRLAADVLRGMERGRALIITPRQARVFWRLARTSPGTVLRGAVANTTKLRELAARPVRV